MFVVGMGLRGRTFADALTEFEIGYCAIENVPHRFRTALADGYRLSFGDLAEPKMWEPMAMQDRRVSVPTEPTFEQSRSITPVADRFFPDLTRVALADRPAKAARFGSIGLVPVVDSDDRPGINASADVLVRLGTDPTGIEAWTDRQMEIRRA